MREKFIFALTGPKGVGKSTEVASAKAALEKNGLVVEVVSFATPIKMMVAALLGRSALHTKNKEKVEFGICGKTPREILQTLGTEWGRKLVGDSVWVDSAVNRIQRAFADVVLIDDLRFDNEANAIKEMGGNVFFVSRDGIEYVKNHESEVKISEKNIDKEIKLDYTNSHRLADVILDIIKR